MKFSEYMNEWLYGMEGYYTKYKKIGKEGDFYTSVSASKFFGGTIAKHIISLVDEGFLKKDSVICRWSSARKPRTCGSRYSDCERTGEKNKTIL